MLRRLGLIAALLSASQVTAADKIVQNDTFTGTGTVNSGISFGEYQGAGVLFTPAAADYPITIKAVDVFAASYGGGAPGNYGAYVMSVWDESGGTLTPPMAFDGGSYMPRVNMQGVQLITSSSQLNRFTLPVPIVLDAGQVFVAVTEQLQTSLDSTTIALDNGPSVTGANWFFNGATFDRIDLADGGLLNGINGNWIIRLVLDVPDRPVTVTSITPSAGVGTADTDVTITGANFELGAEAFVGTTSLTLRGVAPTSIAATVPAGIAPGLYDVRVRNLNGVEGTLPDGYRVLLPDGGTGGELDAGAGGGTGGGTGGGGGTDAGSGGGTGGGGSTGPLTVTSVTPSEMFSEDGARLVLTGEGFLPGAQLLIGMTVIEQVDVKSPSVLNATVPANAVTKGVYDVSVLNLSGDRATLPQALTVYAGTMAKPGCGCTTVEPMSLLGAALALVALRRRRR